MRITGGCFCGELRYEADVQDAPVAVCHCRDCQIFGGSAFRLACPVPPERFEVTKGDPKHFDKTADSGKVRRMVFCGTCGTHICSTSPEPDPGGFVSIRVATADQFGEFAPAAEVYCRSKTAWMPRLEDTVRFSEMPGSAPPPDEKD